MLLAVDIGNTSIKFGHFDDDRLISKFVIPTSRGYDDESIRDAVDGQMQNEFTAAIVSSVVPEIDSSFSAFVFNQFGVEARFIKTTDDFGLTFSFPIDEAGTDRLVNSFAASQKYGTPCIV